MLIPVPADIGKLVRLAAEIAGNVPVIFAAGILVKLVADIAGSVPVIFAAGIAVKFAALIAGKAPDNLLDVSPSSLASSTCPSAANNTDQFLALPIYISYASNVVILASSS